MELPLRGRQYGSVLELNAFLSVRLLFHPAVSLLAVHPWVMKAYMHSKNGCTDVPIAALFTIIKNWRQPRSLSLCEYVNKLWHIHATEYYSAIKGNKLLTHATTWMHFKCIALSNSNHFPTGIYFMISFIWYSEKDKITGIETRSVVAKSGSGGRSDSKGVSWASSLGVEMVLHSAVGGYKTLCICSNAQD